MVLQRERIIGDRPPDVSRWLLAFWRLSHMPTGTVEGRTSATSIHAD